MKDHQWLFLKLSLMVGIALLLPVMKICKDRFTAGEPCTIDMVEIAEADETQPITEAELYLTDLQVVGLQRGDPGFEQALLQAIVRNEPSLDPETGFLWDTHAQPKGYHSQFDEGTKVRPTREAMNFAAMLIASPEDEHQLQGCTLLEKVIGLQDQDPDSATFGIWPWYYEEPLVDMAAPDYNWADFLGGTLVSLLHGYSDRLPPELLKKTRYSLECAARAIIKRDVKPGYTNIAMKGAAVTAAAGELLNRQDLLDYGRMRILRNLEHYRNTGNFNEYNSPNYTPVVIAELERMLYQVNDPVCRLAAAELLIGAWQTVAEHYHVPTQQWAGPFSRTYSDMISPRLRNTILAQALAISPEEWDVLPAGEQPNLSLFVPRFACPESLRHHFVNAPQGEITRQHVFNKTNADRIETGTTWLTPAIALGSASYHTFWAQARGLIAYWVIPDSDKPAILKHVFLHNGNDFASGCARNRQSGGRVLSAFGLLRNQGSMHPTFDRPTDGVFHAESFEIVYQLEAQGAAARELSPNVFELSAGAVRAVLHVADDCVFDDQPVQWHVESGDEREATSVVRLVGTCYRGESKVFALDTISTRIAVGLELLQGDQQPAQAAVLLSDANAPRNRNVAYYGIRWEPITGDKRLIAPAQAMDR
ncbi:MAG: hypothetical protein FWH27_16235 [Planctomycetaceae bacterium]|nr:hypothetical protein [Planctomycetaceae bacterium]